MKIGFEAKRVFHNRSGLGNFSRNLIRSLATYLPENQYLLFNPNRGSISFGRNLPGVEEVRPALTLPILRDLWRQRGMSKTAAKRQIDLFHGLSMELPANLRKHGIPSVVSVHDLIFMRYPHLYKAIDRKIYSAKLKHAIDQASIIVATSEQTQRDLLEFMKVSPERVRVQYQGVSPEYWQRYTADELKKTAEKHRLPAKYGLFVGTLEERKGMRRLLEAQLQTGLDMVYVGRPTAYWEGCLSNQRFEKLKDRIYTPKINDTRELSQIYQGAEFLVYPSLFEGFGIPVLEAQVSQIPVITSNTSSLPEVAGPGAILIDPESTSQLTGAMSELWQSESVRKSAVENNLNFIENFRDEKLVAGWDKIYRSLA